MRGRFFYKWLNSYRSMSSFGFCLRIGVERFFVSLLFLWLFWVLIFFMLKFGCSVNHDLFFPDKQISFNMDVFFGPLIETILFQVIIIDGLMFLRTSWRIQMAFSCFFFMIVHFANGLISLFCAGFVGGLYFAGTYIFWRKQSRAKAFLVTACAHIVSNVIVVFMDSFFQQFYPPFVLLGFAI